jgi:transcription-repair coupling factor (superfamily II helicase)
VDRATHFGLSQLHQLRGRIGRSDRQAYAYFLYNSQDLKGNAKRRLSAISEKEALGSGYELSLEDLDIRGSGNILGEEQHGSMQMVGVGYYLKMLEEAVDRIKNQELGVKNQELSTGDIKIDLPISSYIPDGFYKKEEDKIRAYQRLAGLEDAEDVAIFANELNSKEKVPQEYLNLIEIVKLKIKAKEAGVKSIIAKDVLGMADQKIKKLYIEFDHVLSNDEVNKIFALNRKWYFGNTLVRIDLENLGDDWFRILKVMIESLAKQKASAN